MKEVIYENVEVTSDKTHITMLDNVPQPDGIILNVGDWCYFKQVFDSNTLHLLEHHVQNLKNNLTKSVILRDIYEMVRDGKYSPSKFIQFSSNWVSS